MHYAKQICIKTDICIAINYNTFYYSCQYMPHVLFALTVLRHEIHAIYNWK